MSLRYRALLIGNSSYPDDEGRLPRLEGPINDVPAMKAALEDPEYGLFKPEAITMRIEQSSYELLRTLDDFFTSADSHDVMLVYYSGHGRLDEFGQLYLCARNTNTGRLRSTAIRSDQINEMIEATPAAHIVVILDCCHSGAFKGDDDIVGPVAPIGGRGRYVIAGCRARELANDARSPNHLSLFTSHLVAGLRHQPAREEGPRFVSLDELYEYAYVRVISESRQTPQKRATGEGTLAIAKRARASKPLRLSRTEIHLDNVLAGEALPPERVRVFGLDPDDVWEATTHADWIRIELSADYFDLYMVPNEQMNRANIEVLRRRTAEAFSVRITVFTSSLQLLWASLYGSTQRTGTAPPEAQSAGPVPPPAPAEAKPAEEESTPSAARVVGRAAVPETETAARNAARVADAVRAARTAAGTTAAASSRGPRRATLAVARVVPWSAMATCAMSLAVAALFATALSAVILIPWVDDVLQRVTKSETYSYVYFPFITAVITLSIVLGYNLSLRLYRTFVGRQFGTAITLSELPDPANPIVTIRRARLLIARSTVSILVCAVTFGGTITYWLAQIAAAPNGSMIRVLQWTVAATLATAATTSAYNIAARWRGIELTLAEAGPAGRRGSSRRARLRVSRVGIWRLTVLAAPVAFAIAGVWAGLDAVGATARLEAIFADPSGYGFGAQNLRGVIAFCLPSLGTAVLTLGYNGYVRLTRDKGRIDLTLAERG